jgi:hypothetical protein
MNARSLPPPRPPITLVCVVLWRLLAWTGAWLILARNARGGYIM